MSGKGTSRSGNYSILHVAQLDFKGTGADEYSIQRKRQREKQKNQAQGKNGVGTYFMPEINEQHG